MNSSGSYLLELCLKMANSQLLNEPVYFRRQIACAEQRVVREG